MSDAAPPDGAGTTYPLGDPSGPYNAHRAGEPAPAAPALERFDWATEAVERLSELALQVAFWIDHERESLAQPPIAPEARPEQAERDDLPPEHRPVPRTRPVSLEESQQQLTALVRLRRTFPGEAGHLVRFFHALVADATPDWMKPTTFGTVRDLQNGLGELAGGESRLCRMAAERVRGTVRQMNREWRPYLDYSRPKTPTTANAPGQGEEGTPPADAPSPQYVTLDQMAAMVRRSKRTLEKLSGRKLNPLPDPDIQGGGGKPNEWIWDRVRPWLEAEYGRTLPVVHPSAHR